MTAEELRNITFETVKRGYSVEDVDAFLAQVADQIDHLEAQKKDAEAKMRILAQKVEEYRGQEETLKTALINAQRMGESIVYEAHQRAETLLRESEGQSELLRQQSEREYEAQRQLLMNISGEVSDFRTNILNYYTQSIDKMRQLDKIVEKGEETVEKYPQIQTEPKESNYGQYLSGDPMAPIIPDTNAYNAAPFDEGTTYPAYAADQNFENRGNLFEK